MASSSDIDDQARADSIIQCIARVVTHDGRDGVPTLIKFSLVCKSWFHIINASDQKLWRAMAATLSVDCFPPNLDHPNGFLFSSCRQLGGSPAPSWLTVCKLYWGWRKAFVAQRAKLQPELSEELSTLYVEALPSVSRDCERRHFLFAIRGHELSTKYIVKQRHTTDLPELQDRLLCSSSHPQTGHFLVLSSAIDAYARPSSIDMPPFPEALDSSAACDGGWGRCFVKPLHKRQASDSASFQRIFEAHQLHNDHACCMHTQMNIDQQNQESNLQLADMGTWSLSSDEEDQDVFADEEDRHLEKDNHACCMHTQMNIDQQNQESNLQLADMGTCSLSSDEEDQDVSADEEDRHLEKGYFVVHNIHGDLGTWDLWFVRGEPILSAYWQDCLVYAKFACNYTGSVFIERVRAGICGECWSKRVKQDYVCVLLEVNLQFVAVTLENSSTESLQTLLQLRSIETGSEINSMSIGSSGSMPNHMLESMLLTDGFLVLNLCEKVAEGDRHGKQTITIYSLPDLLPLYSLPSAACEFYIEPAVHFMALSTCGRYLGVSTDVGTLTVYDMLGGRIKYYGSSTGSNISNKREVGDGIWLWYRDVKMEDGANNPNAVLRHEQVVEEEILYWQLA